MTREDKKEANGYEQKYGVNSRQGQMRKDGQCHTQGECRTSDVGEELSGYYLTNGMCTVIL